MTQRTEPPPDTNKSVEPRASTQATREMLVSLYVRGSTNDAKAMYGANPGSTDAGWQALSRMLEPVKQFIADGGTPYTAVAQSTEYAGIPVPEPEEDPAPPPEEDSEPEVDDPGVQSTGTGTGTSAGELVDRARRAKTSEELEEIEGLAAGRVTVQDAVDKRRDELGL